MLHVSVYYYIMKVFTHFVEFHKLHMFYDNNVRDMRNTMISECPWHCAVKTLSFVLTGDTWCLSSWTISHHRGWGLNIRTLELVAAVLNTPVPGLTCRMSDHIFCLLSLCPAAAVWGIKNHHKWVQFHIGQSQEHQNHVCTVTGCSLSIVLYSEGWVSPAMFQWS